VAYSSNLFFHKSCRYSYRMNCDYCNRINLSGKNLSRSMCGVHVVTLAGELNFSGTLVHSALLLCLLLMTLVDSYILNIATPPLPTI
jgi:hypothetical protein